MQDQTMWFTAPFSHYQMPKCLLGPSGLPPDCLIVYTVLLDRMRLSAANGATWVDSDGQIFVYMTVKEVAEICWCSKEKAGRILRRLESENLIRRKAQGLTKPARIYVHPFRKRTEIPTSSDRNSGTLDTCRFAQNNTDTINTENIKTTSTNAEREMVREYIMDNISYELLKQQLADTDCLDAILAVILDTLHSSKTTIRVLGDDIPRAQVVARLNALDDMHIRYVYDRLRREDHKIYSLRQYILSRLYEAEDMMGMYYQTLVQYDLGKEV